MRSDNKQLTEMNFQKKLISIFKTFIEKALLPQIRKSEGSLYQWNKFSSFINAEVINFNQLQLYVDALPATPTLLPEKKQNAGVFLKKKDQGFPNFFDYPEISSPAFNPSKTFGGEKSKNVIYGNKPNQYEEEVKQFNMPSIKEEPYKKVPMQNPIQSMPSIPSQSYQGNQGSQGVISSLQRLLKSFSENQQRIQMLSSGQYKSQSFY